ncbi:MAG: type II secretion system protein [Candidatus Magasanikbacteria bacterium]|nr:type II secretion system protein [Candidatus Magasanikbacteria bacterium]
MKSNQSVRGFTLIEVMVAVAISALFFSAVAEIFLTSFKTAGLVSDELEGQSGARRAVNDFVSQFRLASYSSAGDYPLKTANINEIVFYANIDKDNLIEKVRYYLTDTTLYRGVTKPIGNPLSYGSASETAETLLEGVRLNGNPLFTYYPAGIAEALVQPVDITTVRLAGIYLRVDKKPTASPTAWSVAARAQMRNLKN